VSVRRGRADVALGLGGGRHSRGLPARSNRGDGGDYRDRREVARGVSAAVRVGGGRPPRRGGSGSGVGAGATDLASARETARADARPAGRARGTVPDRGARGAMRSGGGSDTPITAQGPTC